MADQRTKQRLNSERRGPGGIVVAVLASPGTRLIILAVLVIGGSIAIAVMDGLSEDVLEAWVRDAGAAAPIVFIVLYAVLTVLLFPGSVITAAGGVIFGVVLGTVFSVIGASLGAGAAFLVGRWLGRQQVERLAGKRIGALDSWLGERGFVAVLYTRLIPLLPFNALNYALGVTSVSFRDYLSATVVGIIPGTFAYAALGGSFRDPTSPVFITAVALIVILLVAGPFANRMMRGRGAGPPRLDDTHAVRPNPGGGRPETGDRRPGARGGGGSRRPTWRGRRG